MNTLNPPIGPRLICCCSYCDMELTMQEDGLMGHSDEYRFLCYASLSPKPGAPIFFRTNFNLSES